MSVLQCLELSVLLWVAHVLCQAFTARGEFGDGYLFSSRDTPKDAKGVAVGRATRALHNYIENYVPFVAMDLALIATAHPSSNGAILWVLARIAYLPVYLLGIVYVRTLAWVLGVIGLLMMLAQVAGYL